MIILDEIYYPLPTKYFTSVVTEKVKLNDILKIVLNTPMSEKQLFQYIKEITDIDTTISMFSKVELRVEEAKGRVFSEIDGMLLKCNDKEINTGLTVLRELYRMEIQGVPIDGHRMTVEAEIVQHNFAGAVCQLMSEAEMAGVHVTETEIRSSIYFFPFEFSDLNAQLTEVRKLMRHAGMLNPEKLKRYMKISDNGLSPDRIYCHWDFFGSLSGRIQTSEFNVQGLPKRIRESCIIPRSGYSLIYADYVSQELVLIAVLTGDSMLLEKIAQGVDLHKNVAAAIFDKSTGEVSAAERKLAKAIVFAYLYGAGDNTLKKIIGSSWSEEEVMVSSVKKAIHENFSKISLKMEQIAKQGYVTLINGKCIYLADIPKKYSAFNRMVQGSGAIILKDVIYELAQRLPMNAEIVFLLHDEIIIEVPEESETVCTNKITAIMTSALCKYGYDVVMPITTNIKKDGAKYEI